MTLTALIGALLALVPRAKPPEPDPLKRMRDRIETLEIEIEGLNRELSLERALSTHWIAEAASIARRGRLDREQLTRERDFYRVGCMSRQVQDQQASVPLASQMQHQQQLLAVYQQQANAQLAQHGLRQQNAYGDFCNCVPSRGQVFGARK